MEINYKEKVLNLMPTDNQIVSKLIEYEFKIKTFISTLSSFKSDTLLRPFPNDFLIVDKNKKDFDKLHKLIKLIPNLNELNSTTDLPDDCWKLIYWILTFNSIELKLLDKEEVKQLFTNLKLDLSSKLLPNYVFKFKSAHSNHRARHNKLKDEFGFYSAYHGTSFENLHSIIHNNLVNNLNKRDAFGSGTYLSKNLDVAVTFSPYTNVKSNDSINRLSCVLLCDVVSHPSNEVKENSSYLLVKDDNLVNISYLFVYWQKLNNQKRSSLPKFEILLLLLGMACLIYSIYRSNNRY